MLENLLGHFREARPRLARASDVAAGGLADCDRAAYIGSFFREPLPASFLQEAAAYRRPFLWINYNIDQLQKELGPDAFARKTGFRFQRVLGLDAPSTQGQAPGFFRFILYKGRRFVKFAFQKPGEGGLVAAPDLASVQLQGAQVLATAVHSTSGVSTPYIVRLDRFYFVADNPFLFIHEQDRYLVLADLLFDFLELPPRSGKHYALLRLEDVHPQYDLRLLRSAVDLLKRQSIPFAISVIPKYVPPGVDEAEGVELSQRPGFLEALRAAKRAGADILLHGYTHQVGGLRDCVPLGSGFDYEFWDRCRQRPLPYDSEEFVRERLKKAKAILAQARLNAAAWVTPHYAASPEDFRVFAQEFPRTVQRVCYSATEGGKTVFVSQFFPYTIYRDHYGQFVWPENLGFVPLPGSNWGFAAPDDIASSLPLAAVIRDGWASLYWHPILAAQPTEARKLQRLIQEIRRRGFEFVSLSDLRTRGE